MGRGRRSTAAVALGDRDVEAFGRNMAGTSLVMAGRDRRGSARSCCGASRSRAKRITRSSVMSALNMLGTGLGEMMELERAEHYLRECIAFAESQEMWPVYPRSWLALVHVYRGRWDEGARLAGTVLRGPVDPISRISALDCARSRARPPRRPRSLRRAGRGAGDRAARRSPPAAGPRPRCTRRGGVAGGRPRSGGRRGSRRLRARAREAAPLVRAASSRTGNGGRGSSTVRRSGSRSRTGSSSTATPPAAAETWEAHAAARTRPRGRGRMRATRRALHEFDAARRSPGRRRDLSPAARPPRSARRRRAGTPLG